MSALAGESPTSGETKAKSASQLEDATQPNSFLQSGSNFI